MPIYVRCPKCGAEPRHACQSKTGKDTTLHLPRVRMASGEQDVAPLDYRALEAPSRKPEGICPHCGAVLTLVGWRTAKNMVDWNDPTECVDRVRAHEYGGSLKHLTLAKGVTCLGSYGIPAEA
jgi:hypothetical protein